MKQYKVCIYCGEPVAYRYWWNVELLQVYGCLDPFNKFVSFLLFGYSFYPKWKRIIKGACPCEVPAIN